MKIHFIGIGGIGISALAQFCHRRGDIVSGSEAQETVILQQLRNLKIPISIPQKSENVPIDCNLVIYSEAVPSDNPERIFAKKNNISEKSYFELLGDISKNFKTIAVAGTHGKTTTVGLISAGFKSCNFDATVFVGSTLKEFGNSNFHAGTNEFLLVEACEYRENFRFLEPEIVVLTNVELDHPDYYKTKKQYFHAFEKLCSKAQIVIFHENDEGSKKVLENFGGRKIGTKSPDFAKSGLSMKIHGAHNRDNARLSLALAEYLDLDLEKFKSGLAKFTGAGRRQEFLGEKNGVQIYDDYGHHPTEIRATINAFREKYPDSQIALIYEPHQFSRTKQFFNEFCEALNLPDKIGIFPIYEARDTEEDKKSVSIQDLLSKISNSKKIETISDAENLFSKLNKGDVLIFMGAGKISEFGKKFIKIINECH